MSRLREPLQKLMERGIQDRIFPGGGGVRSAGRGAGAAPLRGAADGHT